jgi:amidophosphoribosyltransferase
MGKKVGLVDDSIVRSDTSKLLIQKLRSAGAQAVHMFIPGPRIVNICRYGIYMKTLDELVATRLNLEETRQHIGADSLHHLSLEGYRRCFKQPEHYCMGCLTGTYPTDVSPAI